MFSDVRTTFADSVASGDGTAVIGNVIDLKSTGVDGNVDDNIGGQPHIGNGQPVYVTIVVAEAYTGASATDDISFSLVTSDNAGLTSGTTLLTSANFVHGNGTDLIAGTVVLQAALPIATYSRYLGIVETVSGTTTTGKITAFLHVDPKKYVAYPQASVNL